MDLWAAHAVREGSQRGGVTEGRLCGCQAPRAMPATCLLRARPLPESAPSRLGN